MSVRVMRRPRSLPLVLAVAGTMLATAACGGGSTSGGTAGAAGSGTAGASAGSGGGGTINLVAYSTPQKAYAELTAGFAATPAGKGVSVKQSFGASGAQSRAVVAGQPADVVEFSLETDLTRLVDAGLVAKDWAAGPHKGMVTDSVAVFVVRKGNPKQIKTWDDLVKPGVAVVTPNPFSSGSARWNLMAAYGSQVKSGKSPQEALDFVRALLKNTVAQPESGSKATAAFVAGTGDVLISYENEAIEAQQASQPVDYVVPDQTILIENPVAVTTSTAKPALARGFVDYLYTVDAQKLFAKHGYRPVVTEALDPTRFPTPIGLFTIADLGGWDTVAKQFFDKQAGSITKIENERGVSG